MNFEELAKTELSDKDFFEDVFSTYIKYLYTDLKKVNQNDPHTQYHLRDQIERVLYLHNIIEHDIANADKFLAILITNIICLLLYESL